MPSSSEENIKYDLIDIFICILKSLVTNWMDQTSNYITYSTPKLKTQRELTRNGKSSMSLSTLKRLMSTIKMSTGFDQALYKLSIKLDGY